MTAQNNHKDIAINVRNSFESLKFTSAVQEYIPDIYLPDYHATGTLHSDAVVMKDSTTYAVLRAVAHEPITEVSIGLTPAWWTSTRGHNRHTIEHFMRLGVSGIAIGIEGSYRNPDKVPFTLHMQSLQEHSLLRSAHHMHKILDTIQSNNDKLHIETEDMILLGESRGAMVGKGVLALADLYKRNIPYADLTAPCFPQKFSISKTPDLLKQIAQEPWEFAKLVGSISLRNMVHYPASLDAHPKAIMNNILAGPTLFSGESGELANLIPKEQNMHITTFHDDFASMPHVWEDIYAEHQNVRIERIEGAHLTIAHSKTLEHIDKRIFALLIEMEHCGSRQADSIDFHKVHLGQ